MFDAFLKQVTSITDPILVILLISAAIVIKWLFDKGNSAEKVIVETNKKRVEQLSACKEEISEILKSHNDEMVELIVAHKNEVSKLTQDYEKRVSQLMANQYTELRKRDEQNNKMAEDFRMTVEKFNSTIEKNNVNIDKLGNEVHNLGRKVDMIIDELDRDRRNN